MTLETVIALVTVIGTLAVAVERGVELFRPLWLKIQDPEWQNVAKLCAAIVLGSAVAALINVNVFAILSMPYPPIAGFIFAGLLASGGASSWHAILEWLKTIKK